MERVLSSGLARLGLGSQLLRKAIKFSPMGQDEMKKRYQLGNRILGNQVAIPGKFIIMTIATSMIIQYGVDALNIVITSMSGSKPCMADFTV